LVTSPAHAGTHHGHATLAGSGPRHSRLGYSNVLGTSPYMRPKGNGVCATTAPCRNAEPLGAKTSSSTPPPPPRGLTLDRPPLGSPTGPRRDATRSSREWPTNPALAVCIPHSTNAVCTTRENGIQQPPTAVLAEDWFGFDPHRQRIDHTAPRMCHTLPTNNIISPTHVRRRKFD
jgi:hypothetical protein